MSVCRGSTPPIPVACSHWCCTDVKTNNFTFAWTIKNFSFCVQKTGENILSSTFSVDDQEWRLTLYPRGYDKTDKDYLSLFLGLVSYHGSQKSAKYEFSILDANQFKMNKCSSKEPILFIKGGSYCGFSDFIKHEDSHRYLVDDHLTLVCDISMVEDTVCTSGQSHCTPVQEPECRLGEELGNLLEKSSYSDVILCVGDQEFHVHKSIITARSPVFSAMFEHEMEEKKTSRVQITDVDPDVMRELLRFIYTGRAPNMDKMATELLAAADKYDLKTLKVKCENALCFDLQVDNACEILALADLHSADQLKSRAMDFISSHATAVMDSAGWKDIISTHPQLVTEAFRAVVSQESPSREPPCKRTKLN